MPFPSNNLPSTAQPWARDVQKRVELLESNVKANEINNTARDVQLANSYKRLDKAVNDLIVADAQITIAVSQASDAATKAQQAIDGLGSLDEATSTYKINASNLTAGTITGLNIIGNTIKSAASGTRVEVVGTSVSFYYQDTLVGQMLGNNTSYGSGIYMSSASGVYLQVASTWLGFQYGLNNFMGITGGQVTLGGSNGVSLTGTVSGSDFRVTGSNISGNTSASQGPLVISDYAGYYMKIDGNEISSYAGGSGASLYLNGSGSSGAIILGDGGGNTSVRNQLNAQGGILVTGGGITASSIYSNLISGRDMFITSAGVMGYATSSRKYKRDIEDLQLDTSAILNIKPVSFKYNIGVLKEENGNDPDELQWGFIAEDLHDAGLSGIVDYDPETGDVEGIKYGRFVIALQAVVRHQAEQINNLSARIEALENK